LAGAAMKEESSVQTEQTVQLELDRKLFHIRTLYDVSRELLGMTDMRAVTINDEEIIEIIEG
jgi:hypothetical protein